MLGTQTPNMVPLEPGGVPMPKAPRPRGFFDHLTFANASAIDVTQVHYRFSGQGVGEFQGDLLDVKAEQFGMHTLNLDMGQLQFVEMKITLGDGREFTLANTPIVDQTKWYMGRIQAGLAADPGGGNPQPFAVLILFPDDQNSDEMYVQVVPFAQWG